MICDNFSKEWLLPSLSLNCINKDTYYSLINNLKTLIENLGCFPFNIKPYHFMFVYYIYDIYSFSSSNKIIKPPQYTKKNFTLIYIFNKIIFYLNRFRKKPAIFKFDWTFTPNYKSSPYFATYVSSAY